MEPTVVHVMGPSLEEAQGGSPGAEASPMRFRIPASRNEVEKARKKKKWMPRAGTAQWLGLWLVNLVNVCFPFLFPVTSYVCGTKRRVKNEPNSGFRVGVCVSLCYVVFL